MHLATCSPESRIYYYHNNKKQVDLYTSQSSFTFSVLLQPLGTLRVRHGLSLVKLRGIQEPAQVTQLRRTQLGTPNKVIFLPPRHMRDQQKGGSIEPSL